MLRIRRSRPEGTRNRTAGYTFNQQIQRANHFVPVQHMTQSQNPIPKWQIVTGWVLSCILAVPFLPSAFFKIAQPGDFLENWTKNYPAGAALPLGIIELSMFALYLIPKTRYLGGLIMLAYLGGAVATHVHLQDGNFPVPITIGIIAWLGLYLRDRKLRALVPIVDE
jgi:hypothetical protein